MVNPSALGAIKMSLIPRGEKYGIYCQNNFGPIFGEVHDLCIADKANRRDSSNICLGNSYQCPPGQQSTFFTGAPRFTVTDYEVFGLQQ